MNLKRTAGKALCLLLALACWLGAFTACSQSGEVPDGYQYATCKGEYFRLYVPTQWMVNTESGVSGAYVSVLEEVAVSMTEVPFDKPSAGEGSAETGTAPSDTASADSTATLADFVAAHTATVSGMKNYKAEKNFDSTLGGRHKAVDMTYFATVGETDYRYRQILCKVEGRFYLFTYSAKADAFEGWLDVVDEILKNIEFHAKPFDGSDDERKIPSVDNVPAGMKLVSTNETAYRFFAPTDWVADEQSAACLVYASETDRSNVSVIGYVPETDGYKVADYWEMTEKAYKETLKDYTLISTEEETMGGKNATVYVYTYSLGGVTYKCRQVACVYSYMIVTMTYTALPENYDRHLEDVTAMQTALTFRRPVFG